VRRGNFRPKAVANRAALAEEQRAKRVNKQVASVEQLAQTMAALANRLPMLEGTVLALEGKLSSQVKKTDAQVAESFSVLESKLTNSLSSQTGKVAQAFSALDGVLQAKTTSLLDALDGNALTAAVASLQKRLAALEKAVQGVSKTLAEEQKANNAIATAVSELTACVEGMMAEEPQPKTSVDLEAIKELIRAPKKVLRDYNGELVGWKVDSH